MTAPRLEVRALSKTFAGVTVLKDAYLEVQAGEVHALIGQNGSGKSTLIKLISGVYRADHGGEVFVDGERIGTPVDPGRLHDEGLAFVHQDLGLIPDLSVRENVRVGRHSTARFTGWINKAKDTQAVRETLDFLNLTTSRPRPRSAACVRASASAWPSRERSRNASPAAAWSCSTSRRAPSRTRPSTTSTAWSTC